MPPAPAPPAVGGAAAGPREEVETKIGLRRDEVEMKLGGEPDDTVGEGLGLVGRMIGLDPAPDGDGVLAGGSARTGNVVVPEAAVTGSVAFSEEF